MYQNKNRAPKLAPLQQQDTVQLSVQLFAATITKNQSETPIHATNPSIDSHQRLLHTVTRKVALFLAAFGCREAINMLSDRLRD